MRTTTSESLTKGLSLWQSSVTRKRQNRFLEMSSVLLKQTFQEWLEDKAPQLGAALAYYTVFSLAPLILVLLAIIGVIFRDDPAGAWNKITQQMSYFLDPSAVQVVQNIAQQASQPGKSTNRHDHRRRARAFRRKRCVRSAPGRLEHDLGCESKARRRYLGIFAGPLSLVCNGRRHLFSAARFANPRRPA